MRLFSAERATETNITSVNEFSMKQSAKAFQILSNNIYSNKIEAIVRELGTNAYDAHVAAGKATTPFVVHMPTTSEPWFSVIDEGIGLSPEQTTDLYVTYFESSKTESDDFVGALGLGSKSPYSYTSQFNVITQYDGYRHSYTAFVNEAGVPSLAHMETIVNDAPNGVTVMVPVKEEDIRTFCDTINNVYGWFDVQPIIENGDQIEPVQLKPTPHPKVFMHGSSTRFGSNRSLALMGNVTYPINLTAEMRDLVGPLEKYLMGGIVFKFNIGEVDIQASREELSYIPSTRNAIHKRLIELYQLSAKYIKQQVAARETEWAKNAYINSLKHNTVYWLPAQRIYNINYLDLRQAVSIDFLEKHNIAIKHVKYDSHRKTIVNIPPHKEFKSNARDFVCSEDTYVLLIDKHIKSYLKRLRLWFLKNPAKSVIVIKAGAKSSASAEHLNHVYASLGHPTKITEDDLPELATVLSKTEKRHARSESVIQINYGVNTRMAAASDVSWYAVDNGSLPTGKKYYVKLSGYEPVDWKLSLDVKSVFYYLNATRFSVNNEICKTYLNNIPNVVYGVRKQAWDLLDDDNWVPFDKFVLDTVNELCNNVAIVAYFGSMTHNRILRFLANNSNTFEDIDEQSPFSQVVNYATRGRINNSALTNLVRAVNKEWIVRNEEQYTSTKQIIAKYPLLEHIEYSTGVNPADIAHYVNFIDGVK